MFLVCISSLATAVGTFQGRSCSLYLFLYCYCCFYLPLDLFLFFILTFLCVEMSKLRSSSVQKPAFSNALKSWTLNLEYVLDIDLFFRFVLILANNLVLISYQSGNRCRTIMFLISSNCMFCSFYILYQLSFLGKPLEMGFFVTMPWSPMTFVPLSDFNKIKKTFTFHFTGLQVHWQQVIISFLGILESCGLS